jgi:hypothetical protein
VRRLIFRLNREEIAKVMRSVEDFRSYSSLHSTCSPGAQPTRVTIFEIHLRRKHLSADSQFKKRLITTELLAGNIVLYSGTPQQLQKHIRILNGHLSIFIACILLRKYD